MLTDQFKVNNHSFALEYGNLSRPDGSALYAHGETVVQAAVYGPTEVRQNKELIDKSYIEVIYRSKIGISGCKDRVKENLIKNTVESATCVLLYPRTAITVAIQEIQDSGCLLAACVNASVVAMMDSGLAMKNTVAAVSCSIMQNNEVIINPTKNEETKATANLTFVFESQENKLSAFASDGFYSQEILLNCRQACSTAAAEIFQFYRTSVERRFCTPEDSE